MSDLIAYTDLNALLQPGNASDTVQNARKATVCTAVSQFVLNEIGSPVLVPASDATEYHSLSQTTQNLYLMQSPIVSVASVYEDPSWQSKATSDRYGSDTLLVVDTDYIVSKPSGNLFRVARAWARGRRAIKVVAKTGLAGGDLAAVQMVALELAALVWRDWDRRETGVLSKSDGIGGVVRMLPAIMTTAMKDKLAAYKRIEISTTGERDAA